MTNNRQNDYVGVNLYTDDNAGMYNAPSNRRATEFAFYCGKQLEVRHRGGYADFINPLLLDYPC